MQYCHASNLFAQSGWSVAIKLHKSAKRLCHDKPAYLEDIETTDGNSGRSPFASYDRV